MNSLTLDAFQVELAKIAGYKLQGHTEVQGIPIAIENRKGSVRKGKDSDGNEWRTKMKHPYGYIKGTSGADGEEVDAYVGPDKQAPKAFVVHQHNDDGKGYDEDKVMLGFKSRAKARKAYLAHYDDPKFLGPISVVPVEKLRKMVESKKKLTKISSVRVRTVEALQKVLKPGDILSTAAREPGIISKIVSGVQRTPYGHSAIYIGNGRVVDTRRATGVFETTLAQLRKGGDKFGDSRGTGFDIRVSRPKATAEEKKRAVELARAHIGIPYNDKGALRLLLPASRKQMTKGQLDPEKAEAVICSEIVTRSYPTLQFAEKRQTHTLPVDIDRSPLVSRIAELR